MSASSDNTLTRFLFDLSSAVLLLVVALGGCLLPRVLALRGRAAGNERGFSFQLGNMLSAGVMLSAGFCHLLADAIPRLEDAIPKFPLAPFLCALGYLVTLTADTYVSRLSGHHHHHKSNGSRDLLLSNHQSSSSQRTTQAAEMLELSNQERRHVTHNGISSSTPADLEAMEQIEVPSVSFLTALFLGVALSLHSILEGLALGAQQTIAESRDILLAIAAHKGLAAYALGASLVDSKTTFARFWTVAGTFSIASPVGIMVGFGLSEVSNKAGASSLSALASGTFLYVAMMEIIPKELNGGENVTWKLFAMFLGFGAMSTLAIWT